jgi:CheY-like chemotaxis protein
MPARILIVDDSPSARSFLKKLLETHPGQWKVCGEAVNGLEAVQKAVELKPDLIIVDLQMPIMDGLTASGSIAQSLPGIPILMSTIHKSEQLDLQARKVGLRGVVSKEDPRALLSAIEALLGEKKNPIRPVENDAGV